MKRTMFLICGLFLCFAHARVAAQTAATGALTGSVVDSSGAAVPNASVTITNISTGETRTLASGPDGTFRAALLPPGAYTLKIEKSGLKTVTQSNIRLVVTEVGKINLVL